MTKADSCESSVIPELQKPTLTTTPTTTKDDNVEVEVNGEIGATVFANGVDSGKTIDSNGKVKVLLDTSGDDGEKNFSISLKDDAGNESSALNLTITKSSSSNLVSKYLFSFYKQNVNSFDLSEMKTNNEHQLNWDWGHINLIFLKLKINKFDSDFEIMDSWNNNKGFSVTLKPDGNIYTKLRYNNDYIFQNIDSSLEKGKTYYLVVWIYYGISIMTIDEDGAMVSFYKSSNQGAYTTHAGNYSSTSHPIAYVNPTYIKGNQEIKVLETFSVKNMDKYFNLKSSSGYHYPNGNLMKSHIEKIFNQD